MEKLLKCLGDNVRHFRNISDISQQKLAEECGVTTYYISGIERGHNAPSLKVLAKISDALDVPIYMFFLDPSHNDNQAVKLFSKDLGKQILKLIDDSSSRY